MVMLMTWQWQWWWWWWLQRGRAETEIEFVGNFLLLFPPHRPLFSPLFNWNWICPKHVSFIPSSQFTLSNSNIWIHKVLLPRLTNLHSLLNYEYWKIQRKNIILPVYPKAVFFVDTILFKKSSSKNLVTNWKISDLAIPFLLLMSAQTFASLCRILTSAASSNPLT